MISVVRQVSFATKEEKAAYMQEAAQQDSRTPEILAVAERFWGIKDDWARARAILQFCQYCIQYVKDPGPGIEILDSSDVGLWRGFGDCDLKARMCVALMLASGLHAEIEPIYRGDSFPHVRARVYLNHRWWSMDPSIVNSDIGQIPTRGIMTSYQKGGSDEI
jgi:transglutaminase-like putative cysteine protease